MFLFCKKFSNNNYSSTGLSSAHICSWSNQIWAKFPCNWGSDHWQWITGHTVLVQQHQWHMEHNANKPRWKTELCICNMGGCGQVPILFCHQGMPVRAWCSVWRGWCGWETRTYAYGGVPHLLHQTCTIFFFGPILIAIPGMDANANLNAK